MKETEQLYDEGVPASHNAKVPNWLWITYLTLPFWGVAWAYFFWDGSAGWFDRGAWYQLQQAANTTALERPREHTENH